MPTSPRDRATAWLLVVIQAALLAAVVLLPRDPAWEGPGWLPIAAWTALGGAAALGLWGARHLGDGLTPLPLPNGSVDLVTRGPYRWMRHPIYTAVILGAIAVAIRSGTPLVLAAALVLTIFLGVKARWEERHLRAAFDGYADYARRVGRFIPGIGKG